MKMKIQCPKCKSIVPSDQINVSTDLAFCPNCSEGFKISESIDLGEINETVLDNPPKGAWFRQEYDKVILGASTRSPIALFLVPFMCVWSGGALGGIYGSQIAKGEFDLESSLFGIPFILGSMIFWSFALMAVCGKVELSIGRESSIFVGVGKLGWTRKFDWSDVQTIREQTTSFHYPGGHNAAIFLEGKKRIKFGTSLNEGRRFFILNSLKYLKSKTR